MNNASYLGRTRLLNSDHPTIMALDNRNLTNLVVEWKGENTRIQNMGINHDFGIYDSPDDFYSHNGSNLSGLKDG
ncbi:MAG: hypothetical protein PF482_20725 [Desulfobacteraceae bacterium]|jgi:hypothetical protein|nr:hypothetical protein [Desulfobacteraceae bacterium]